MQTSNNMAELYIYTHTHTYIYENTTKVNQSMLIFHIEQFRKKIISHLGQIMNEKSPELLS